MYGRRHEDSRDKEVTRNWKTGENPEMNYWQVKYIEILDSLIKTDQLFYRIFIVEREENEIVEKFKNYQKTIEDLQNEMLKDMKALQHD